MLLVLLMVQKSGKLTSRGTRHVTIPWFTKSLGVFKIRIQTVVGYLGFLKQQNSIMIRWFVDVHPTTSLRRWLSRLMIKVNMCFRFFFSRKKNTQNTRNHGAPPMPPPLRKYGLIRGLSSDNDSMMVSSPLNQAFFSLGGWHWGVPLDSHYIKHQPRVMKSSHCRGQLLSPPW